MKRYLLPIAALFLIVFACYYFFDESQRSYAKAQKSYEGMKAQVESSRRQRDASSDQIVALNKNVRDSVDFLAQWKNYYLSNKDYDSLIGKVAEKTNCVVVERKWESKKVSMGKLEYTVECFIGSVVGDYKDIVNFIGQMESQQQLCAIEHLDFKDGIGGVTCTMEILMPVLPFTGQVSASSTPATPQDAFAVGKPAAATPVVPQPAPAATPKSAGKIDISTVTGDIDPQAGESTEHYRQRLIATLKGRHQQILEWRQARQQQQAAAAQAQAAQPAADQPGAK